MYISVRRYNITDESAIDEIVHRATTGFMPIISQTPGFIAYYGIATEDKVIATVSIFEDQAGVEESNQRAAEWVLQNLAHYVTGIPQITAGEVEFHQIK
jgi:hypothetical protein